MAPEWVGQYIGLEFAERGRGPRVDCWGLIRKIFREQFDLDLPSYTEAYRTTTDEAEIGALVRREAQTVWMPVPPDAARLGDVLVLRMRGQPMHAGLCVEAPWFLHCAKGIGSVLERWDAALWMHRVTGIYRHRELRP